MVAFCRCKRPQSCFCLPRSLTGLLVLSQLGSAAQAGIPACLALVGFRSAPSRANYSFAWDAANEVNFYAALRALVTGHLIYLALVFSALLPSHSRARRAPSVLSVASRSSAPAGFSSLSHPPVISIPPFGIRLHFKSCPLACQRKRQPGPALSSSIFDLHCCYFLGLGSSPHISPPLPSHRSRFP